MDFNTRGMDVVIGDVSVFSEGNPTDNNYDPSYFRARALAETKRKESRLRVVAPNATLADLARALNTIGASPKDLISILQAMKKAGAIKAEIEVI